MRGAYPVYPFRPLVKTAVDPTHRRSSKTKRLKIQPSPLPAQIVWWAVALYITRVMKCYKTSPLFDPPLRFEITEKICTRIITGQSFDSQGTAFGGNFQVNTYSTYDQYYASVAASDDGEADTQGGDSSLRCKCILKRWGARSVAGTGLVRWGVTEMEFLAESAT